MPGMEGAEGHGSPFWGGKGGYNATDGHYERRERLFAFKGHTKGSLHSQWPFVAL